ncbi:MAG: lantibiotic dehydratase, partial [Planctomycetes bacterium]|nr:lantibiotic dehydratase [Planctomycetota bacterium]
MKDRIKTSYEAAGFFFLRTPLLPFDVLKSWGDGVRSSAQINDALEREETYEADKSLLRERLGRRLESAEIREALFIASPSLNGSFKSWADDPESEAGRKLERAVVRYFLRMAGRATPFGLFAGGSLGRVDSTKTRLILASLNEYRRHTRLDMDYLSTLAATLAEEDDIKYTLDYFPNSSLYRAADRVRYAEARRLEKTRSYHLVAADCTEYLEAVLKRAENGAPPDELAKAVVEIDPRISPEEAGHYVEELMEGQIIEPHLSPAVTGGASIRDLAVMLGKDSKNGRIVDRLNRVCEALQEIDQTELGIDPKRYIAIADDLKALPSGVDLSRLFQVDMTKPVECATLGPEVIEEFHRGIEVLRRLAGTTRHDPLYEFRKAFADRYQDREVPLVVALDEEAGVGFERSGLPGAEASPLLEGLDFSLPPGDRNLHWNPFQELILRKFSEAQTSRPEQIDLNPDDLEGLEPPSDPLPGAFAVMGRIAASSEKALDNGDFQILIKGVFGPSGVNLLGRFCHSDPVLKAHVTQYLRAEENLKPDALFAEIVHLPEGRAGNILARPLLREYEIPFLGRSGAPEDKQIPVTDLWISVRNGRVVLRSARLGFEVVPRLTCAHNFMIPNSIGLYRFLCLLQSQGVSGGLEWNWGAFKSEPFLPRVVSGRVVLSRARWLLKKRELEALDKARGACRSALIQNWREEKGIPRWIALVEGDNELLLDLDNVLCIESFSHLVRNRNQAELVEMFPEPDRLLPKGPEGRFVHELIVPFLQKPEEKPTLEKPLIRSKAPGTGQQYPPGSQWLFTKIYTGTSTADRILRDFIKPLTEEAFRKGLFHRFFFIRYG